MTEDERQHVIDELQTVIDDTHVTLKRFEVTGMDEEMSDDYDKLLAILNDALKQQRHHTLAVLDASEPLHRMPPE